MNYREIIQHAEGNGLVIKIHPLDLAELIDSIGILNATVINATVTDTGVDKSYILIGDKVYYQTTTVPPNREHDCIGGIMSDTKVESAGMGFTLASVLTIIFVLAKLAGKITWSWLWVFAPLWISVTLGLTLMVVVFLVAVIFAILE